MESKTKLEIAIERLTAEINLTEQERNDIADMEGIGSPNDNSDLMEGYNGDVDAAVKHHREMIIEARKHGE